VNFRNWQLDYCVVFFFNDMRCCGYLLIQVSNCQFSEKYKIWNQLCLYFGCWYRKVESGRNFRVLILGLFVCPGTRSFGARVRWQTANTASGPGFARCGAGPWSTGTPTKTVRSYRHESRRGAATPGETEGQQQMAQPCRRKLDSEAGSGW